MSDKGILMTSQVSQSWRTVGMVGAALLLLACAGCRETEKARPLDFTPHVYAGEKLPSLTEQQTRNLQERGNLQK